MSKNPSEYRLEQIAQTDAQILMRGVHSDTRGFFQKPFIANYLEASSSFSSLTEINLSHSAKKGTVRGFHLQSAPYSETKIVTCVTGSLLDVVIDCRKESPSYGAVCLIPLNEHDGKSVIVPKGFAHGFQTLADNTTLLYCVDQGYEPKAQLGINPLSESLRKIWPLEVTVISPEDDSLPHWENFMIHEPRIQ